jgi:hypothetical protein
MILEDHDDFLRDIEILPNQTFEDFHKIILSTTGLNGQELASFYTCNSNWRKQKEITLIDMNDEQDVADEVEEDENIPKKHLYVMNESKIRDFIEDPHQRIIYEYDFFNLKTFFIELSKIITADEPESAFPRCVKSQGNLPQKPVLKTGTSGDEGMNTELSDEDMEDDALFGDGDNFEISPDFSEFNEGFEELKF